MKIVAFFLFIAAAFLVILLIRGVQKAKRKGEYLQPDNLKEYGVVDVDETTLSQNVFPQQDPHTEQAI